MNKSVLLLLALLFHIESVAQTYNWISGGALYKDSIRLCPELFDAFTRERISSNYVAGYMSIMDGQDSTLLLKVEPDTLIVNGNFWGYVFEHWAPRRSKYLVKIEQVGYEPCITELTIPKKVYGKPVHCVKFDVLLYKEAKQLQEVTVQASKILMVNKGDTIEYNASAFRLSEGSMLDALIRNLPGVKLDEYGRITVNGEFVSSLLVNGRDFFKGDPKIALDNLPAYTVNKVQVYRKTPESAYLFREDSVARTTDPLVMDVKLKREYAQGWITNYEAAGGIETDRSGKGLYMGRLFAMRYTDYSSLAIFGNVNNISDQSMEQRRMEEADETGNGRSYFANGRA